MKQAKASDLLAVGLKGLAIMAGFDAQSDDHPDRDRLIAAAHRGLQAVGVPSGGRWIEGYIIVDSVAHLAMLGAVALEAAKIANEQ